MFAFFFMYTQSGKIPILLDCLVWRSRLTKQILIYWLWGYWNAVSRIVTTNFIITTYAIIYQNVIRFQCLGSPLQQNKQHFLIPHLESWCTTLLLLNTYWNAYVFTTGPIPVVNLVTGLVCLSVHQSRPISQ